MRWRTWLVLLLAWGFLGNSVEAQRRIRPPPQYKTWGEPDQAKGLSLLQSFRESWLPGEYYLAFSLRTYGSGRPDLRIPGRLFGGQGPGGPASLIEIGDGVAGVEPVRYLILNGPAPAVWRWSEEGTCPERLSGEALREPILATDITPFDLQLPYLYWKDFVYEGLTRFRGRPTEVFILYPPVDEMDLYPGITGVRLYLDAQFNAMMQASILNGELEVVKEINLLEIRKIDESWIAKSIDVRRPDGAKTRFRVEAASMDNRWREALFHPESLTADLPPVAEEELTRIE